MPGYASYLEMRPATGLVVVLLSNLELSPERIGRNLAALVAP